jgi:uncharacterized membrane protein YuzA (DUF378 family)
LKEKRNMQAYRRRRLVGLVSVLVAIGVLFAAAILLTPHDDVAPLVGPGMPWALLVIYAIFGVFVVTFFLMMPQRSREVDD